MDETPPSSPLPEPTADAGPIWQLLFTGRALPVTVFADELGLFARVAGRPVAIEDVAEMFDLGSRAAEAIVAVTAALGFLEARADGRFRITETGRMYLLPDSPYYYGDLLGQWVDQEQVAQIREAANQDDQPVEARAVELEEMPEEELRGFMQTMHTVTFPGSNALARREVFGSIDRLLDVGGGTGSLVIPVLAQHPHLECTLLELPSVTELAREYVADYGLEDRVEFVAGDMFEPPWPGGHDGVYFGHVFHNWDPDRCRFLAQQAFEALEPGGTVLLHEWPLHEQKNGPSSWRVSP